jgi:hypothetical protein
MILFVYRDGLKNRDKVPVGLFSVRQWAGSSVVVRRGEENLTAAKIQIKRAFAKRREHPSVVRAVIVGVSGVRPASGRRAFACRTA